ncbi:MAG: 4Fe-4S dicluster domain-containing protein [bacterium]|nr:4Fe-4S dicluster domain-containing protein [bacterium]
MDDTQLVDYTKSLDCIHCGLCLHTCPTYQLSGREASSPRGRIHLMRAVAEERLEPDDAFAEEMDFCLVCRHCESVCPAGVQFGAMMEHTRSGLEARGGRGVLARFARWLGFGVVLPSRFWLRLAVGSAGLAQRLGLARLTAPLLGSRKDAIRHAPRIPGRKDRRALPALTPARGSTKGSALVLEGCVMPELFGRVNRATAGVLAASGRECKTAPGHVCCGALHAHNGELEHARELARGTIRAFDDVDADLPVVVNSAGCGAHMKEYTRLLADDPEWAERAAAFSARVVDFSEAVQLDDLQLTTPEVAGPVTYDDPCHLCHGQGVRAEPRELLDAIPGIERVELEKSESCCGSAGIYSVLRAADSLAVLNGKLNALEKSGARVLVTANPGCHLQWQVGVNRRGLDVEVLHLAELLERASEGLGVRHP